MSSSQRGPFGYMPVHIKVADRAALVVGGGRVAFPEIRRLIDFGAMVEVVAPLTVAEIADLAVTHGHRMNVQRRKFDASDEKNIVDHKYVLVVACSGHSQVDDKVIKLCLDHDVLVCQADCYDRITPANVMLPAVRKRGHVKISVGTDSICTPLARTLLERVEVSVGGRIDKYMLFLDNYKRRLDRLDEELKGRSDEEIQEVYTRLAQSDEIASACQRENFDDAMHLAEIIINGMKPDAAIL